jgi:hypothetical protein
MALIKSINLLKLSELDFELLEKRAELHRRFSSIEFKILEASEQKIVIRVTQDKSHAGNYFDNKRLSEIGKELFDGIQIGAAIITRPIPYVVSPTEVVTPEWIRDQFEKHNISLKQAGVELGVDPNTLSAYKSGLKPLSGITKAALYYYFSQMPGK